MTFNPSKISSNAFLQIISFLVWFSLQRVADKWTYMGIDGEMTSNYSSVL